MYTLRKRRLVLKSDGHYCGIVRENSPCRPSVGTAHFTRKLVHMKTKSRGARLLEAGQDDMGTGDVFQFGFVLGTSGQDRGDGPSAVEKKKNTRYVKKLLKHSLQAPCQRSIAAAILFAIRRKKWVGRHGQVYSRDVYTYWTRTLWSGVEWST